ncbi:MAG TPA: ABC transporter substrate-binding protein [Vicinamibacterales bacterium]|nr:ABC transporter substrate-binding protein [Vicinamibacterales bacterium]
MSRHSSTELVALLSHARLIRVNRATQEVEPWLAERWTTSPDGQTYTLTLREDLRWSDGQPFTSADVAFTFAAIFDPRVKSVLANSLEVDGQPLTVATPDARTVVVTFPKPFGPGIRLLDNVVMLPAHKLQAALSGATMADTWTTATPPADLVGMGPFVLTRYEPGQRLTFARNPHYWRRDDQGQPLPYLDGLVLEILPDADTELLRLGAGQIDVMQQQLRAEDVATARDLERKGVVSVQEAGVALDSDTFFFNLRPAVWAKDPRGKWLATDAFRQALSHAVDREAYANTVFLGAAVPVHGPITPGNKTWFWPDLPRYRFDQSKARGLLAGLGLSNRDADPWLEDAAGTEARFTLLTFQSIERGAQVLKESFEGVGVAVDLVPLEPGALIERLLAGNFDAIFFNYVSSDTDPALQADFWLSSGSGHIWHISEPTPATPWEAEIDALMTGQAAAVDPAERTRLFREVQRVFSEHLPALYFAAPRIFLAVGRRVRNTTPGIVPPQLLWSADTLSVVSPAPSR